jgi:hypothetical protein
MAHDVEAYLNGELQGEALDAFERQLQRDPALRAELEQQRNILNALQQIRIRDRIADAADQNRRDRVKRRLVLVLTVLTLLGGLLLLYCYCFPAAPSTPAQAPPTPPAQNNPASVPQQAPPLAPSKNPRQPIAQNQAPPRPLIRGGDEPELDKSMLPLFDTVMLQNPPLLPIGGAFNAVAAQLRAHAYSPALTRLQKMNLQSAPNDTVQYLTGLCLLLQKKPVNASAYLFPLNRPGSPFREETQWLLGLDFLLQGKKDAAIGTLKLVQKNAAHPRSIAAGMLLEKIALEKE